MRRAGLIALYAVLLIASHAVRRARLAEATFSDPALTTVPLASGGASKRPTVGLAYREWGPERPDAPVVVLLHGSPGDSSNFDGLGPLLGAHFRVLAPDLPGFGSSTRKVPDYSIMAHSRYVADWVEQLGIAQAHFVGFSMGGGVALHLNALASERVASVVMLSAIGVQELELLGQYHANHALHGLQLGALWLLHEGLPHFGVLDDFPLNVAYARNFYDTDQRPLRGLLQRFAGPMLIIHGDHDVLVPYAAAQEHHRLVPQSKLVTLNSNHFVPFVEPERLVSPMVDFVQRVDTGRAVRRNQASAARVRATNLPASIRGAPARGTTLLVFVVLLALATMASEDLTCIAAGLLAAQGRISFVAAAFGCFVGIFVGDLLLFAAGRYLGRPWLHRVPLKWIVREEDLARSQRWFEERGGLVIFLSRFVPGTRLPTYVSAGLLRMPARWFALRLFVPVALWTPLLVGVSMVLGDRLVGAFERFPEHGILVFVGMLVGVWLLLGVVRILSNYRQRRLLVGWLRRCTRWEYWPIAVIYPPVVVYVLWLGLRFRGMTLFTAANPGIPSGGFAGESKLDILGRLDQRYVPSFTRVAATGSLNERCAVVRAFLDQHDLDLPVVLKPDTGERGSDVVVIRDHEAIAPYLEQAWQDTIVQQYVPGPELGVFYVRIPGEARGRIFSTTEKRLPAVVGDGVCSLERLILEDPCAVTRASHYLERFAGRLEGVPAAAETVGLGELGVHSRGALFLDGARLVTPAFEAAVDAISRGFPGFYFGRFDLRAPSLEAFAAGTDIKVLELNGVTSEATHIYDPQYGLGNAYRVLFEQWRIAFEIGHINRQNGTQPMTIGALLRLIRDYRRR